MARTVETAGPALEEAEQLERCMKVAIPEQVARARLVRLGEQGFRRAAGPHARSPLPRAQLAGERTGGPCGTTCGASASSDAARRNVEEEIRARARAALAQRRLRDGVSPDELVLSWASVSPSKLLGGPPSLDSRPIPARARGAEVGTDTSELERGGTEVELDRRLERLYEEQEDHCS